MSQADERSIIVIGGGIIGCTIAYYITHHPSFAYSSTKVTVLEASAYGVAQGASGKAGGLVARWAYPQPLVDISFEEHVRLAELHGGAERWGWRYVNCGNWEGRGELVIDDDEEGEGLGVKGDGNDGQVRRRKSLEKTLGLDGGEPQSGKGAKKKATGLPRDLNWMAEDLTHRYTSMAPPRHTAQVHPYLFTTSMLSLAQSKGTTLITGKATSIKITDGNVTGVEYTNPTTQSTEYLSATHVVLAAGAWSPALIPSLPVGSTRAHSITIHPPQNLLPIAPYVLFTEITPPIDAQDKQGTRRGTAQASPEIYARPGPDGEVYACGPGDDTPLPPTLDEVAVDNEACEDVWKQVRSVSRVLRTGKVDRRQACYLPVVEGRRSGPIIGAAENVAKGLFVATGHTCWGICNAPGTARALAELVMEGKIWCTDLKSLQPSLFF